MMPGWSAGLCAPECARTAERVCSLRYAWTLLGRHCRGEGRGSDAGIGTRDLRIVCVCEETGTCVKGRVVPPTRVFLQNPELVGFRCGVFGQEIFASGLAGLEISVPGPSGSEAAAWIETPSLDTGSVDAASLDIASRMSLARRLEAGSS
jgi:hypothetical protein